MVLAPERVEERVTQPQVSEERVDKPKEDVIDSEATVKFIEAITGRRIRPQVKVDHAKIQSGKVKVLGRPVDQYIGRLNDAFRDSDIDVVAGPGYTAFGNRVYRTVNLLIKPGVPEVDRAIILAGAIPATVPRNVRMVYTELGLLTPPKRAQPWIEHPNRITQRSERIVPRMMPADH